MLHALSYSTLLGGDGEDIAYGLAVDKSGNAYVTGVSTVLPGVGSGHPFPVQMVFGQVVTGHTSAFVTGLSQDGSRLILSSLLAGGTAYDVAVDESGAVYFGGDADYDSLPVTVGAYRGVGSGFVVKLNANGARLVYSTRLPGRPRHLNLTRDNHVLVMGLTWEQVPTTPDSPHPCSDGNQQEQFLLELNAAGSDRVYATYLRNEITTDGVTVWSVSQAEDPAANEILEQMPIYGSGAIGITCVASAATFWSGPVAPGEIVSIFGLGIGPDTPASLTTLDEFGKVATTLGGLSVNFNGMPAPLLYVSKNQINAVAPFELAGWPSTSVTILKPGAVLPEVNIPVIGARPGVFVLVNEDGTANSSSNPARQGSVMTIYATGAGVMQPAAATGSVGQGTTSIAQDVGLILSSNFGGFSQYSIQNTKLPILYAGDAPTLVQGVVVIVARWPGIPPPELATSYLYVSVGGYQTEVPLFVH